jgi:1,4-alpha-glucan branching enzyme
MTSFKAAPVPAAESPKPSMPWPPSPAPQKIAVAAKAPQTTAPTAPKTVNVSFAFVKPGAARVSLCGEFNGWSPEATPMKSKEGGRWEMTLALRPGRYQYKFVADGQWIHDPSARENVPNEHGSLNSVVEVRL